jgi:hypothetical protein
MRPRLNLNTATTSGGDVYSKSLNDNLPHVYNGKFILNLNKKVNNIEKYTYINDVSKNKME